MGDIGGRFQNKSLLLRWIEQKGMTFVYDFGYSFTLFSSLLKKKRKEEKENE